MMIDWCSQSIVVPLFGAHFDFSTTTTTSSSSSNCMYVCFVAVVCRVVESGTRPTTESKRAVFYPGFFICWVAYSILHDAKTATVEGLKVHCDFLSLSLFLVHHPSIQTLCRCCMERYPQTGGFCVNEPLFPTEGISTKLPNDTRGQRFLFFFSKNNSFFWKNTSGRSGTMCTLLSQSEWLVGDISIVGRGCPQPTI